MKIFYYHCLVLVFSNFGFMCFLLAEFFILLVFIIFGFLNVLPEFFILLVFSICLLSCAFFQSHSFPFWFSRILVSFFLLSSYFSFSLQYFWSRAFFFIGHIFWVSRDYLISH